MKQVNMDSRSLWIQMLLQAGIMVLLALVVGTLGNSLRQENIPLGKDWAPEVRLTEGLEGINEITLEDAEKFYSSGQAVFLDARYPAAYREGHIRGARSLPWESVEQLADQVLADIPLDATIVTYCDGERCELSMNLARELFFRGYENVQVLFNGWTRWRNAELPVSKGQEP